MKGLILCGGRGTRLLPLTKVTNKHLLPVYDKPMVYYPIETMKKMGITDIMIITGKESAGDFLEILGSGKDFGCKFTYRLQDQADGIAGAIELAEDFVNGEKFAVLLGDNIFEDNFIKEKELFESMSSTINIPQAVIFAKPVEDPKRFGVIEFGKDNTVLSIEEKPKNPKSMFAQTGLYFYDENAFKFIRILEPSGRGELEVTDLNNYYLNKGIVKCGIVQGFWSDAGMPESLFAASKFVKNKQKLC